MTGVDEVALAIGQALMEELGVGRWHHQVSTAADDLHRRLDLRQQTSQRRELGLPKATGPAPQRIAERGSLEIQAYDDVCFPGLTDEWAKWDGQRPFVGTLTMELATDADEEVA